MKYQKKPSIIEARQVTVHNAFAIAKWCGGHLDSDSKLPVIIIPTWHGGLEAGLNDYIILDKRGEFYPCKLDVFMADYELATKEAVPFDGVIVMTLGEAIEKMRQGYYVQRQGWNGKGMYIYLTENAVDNGDVRLDPFIVMKHAGGGIIPWLCSQADLLAQDWQIAMV